MFRPFLLLGLVALASCGGGSTGPNPQPPPPPPPAPTVSVAPPTLTLTVGETGQLNATVTGSSASVTWSSSATGVATVSQTGLVTAAGVGTATITASLTGQSNIQGTATVTVNAPPVAIGVTGITQNGQAVTLTDVKKTITFAVDLTVPATFNGSARVLLGTKVAGSVPIVNGVAASPGATAVGAAAPALGVASIQVATTPVDVVSGEVIERFQNGDVTSLLQVLDANQNVVATTPGPGLRLNNATAAVVTTVNLRGLTAVRAGRTFATEAELRIGSANYGQGDISAISAGEIERVEVLTGPAQKIVFGGNAVGGVIDVILRNNVDPASGGTRNAGEGTYRVLRANATIGTVTGPIDILNLDPIAGVNLVRAEWNLDALPPRIPFDKTTLQLGSTTAWINQDDPLADRLAAAGLTWTGTNPTVIDEGAGGVTCGIHYSTNGVNFSSNPILKGGDIGFETPSPTLRLRLQCTDALGQLRLQPVTNGITTSSQQIGTDFTKPILTFQNNRGAELGFGALSVNPTLGLPLLYSGTDPGGSGLAATDPYRVKVLRGFDGATPQQECFGGTFLNDMCMGLPFALDRYVPVFGTGSSEYQLKVGVKDRAFNFSGYQTRQTILDVTDPVPSGLSLDATLTAGLTFSLGWTFTDDLEVAGTAYGIGYQGVTTVPVFGYQVQGSAFDGIWKKSATISHNLKFSASLEQLSLQTNGFYYPTGIERKASSLLYGGVDIAGNGGWLVANIAPRITYDFTSFRVGATGLDRIEFTQPSVTLCYDPSGTANCLGNPRSAAINIDAYYPAGGVSRIDEMFLAKVSMLEGQETALLFDQPMTTTRQNFGSFFIDRYSFNLSGNRYLPGNYQLTFYGKDVKGNLLEGRRIPYTVISAQF
ncbi:MAG: TonB-dependent receptor plug domain-containing protein [Gemmatimonadales bacterium]|nr:TonB-dependent receptor plug domain-containing protein [Gemmatimonadales bacterium]